MLMLAVPHKANGNGATCKWWGIIPKALIFRQVTALGNVTVPQFIDKSILTCSKTRMSLPEG